MPSLALRLVRPRAWPDTPYSSIGDGRVGAAPQSTCSRDACLLRPRDLIGGSLPAIQSLRSAWLEDAPPGIFGRTHVPATWPDGVLALDTGLAWPGAASRGRRPTRSIDQSITRTLEWLMLHDTPTHTHTPIKQGAVRPATRGAAGSKGAGTPPAHTAILQSHPRPLPPPALGVLFGGGTVGKDHSTGGSGSGSRKDGVRPEPQEVLLHRGAQLGDGLLGAHPPVRACARLPACLWSLIVFDWLID